MQKPLAVYAGSFDPVTLGHLDLIRRARRLFGPLVVLVMQNGAKQPLFSVQERVELLKEALAGETDITVDTAQGLVADYVKKHKIPVFVRGLRGAGDLEPEMAQVYYNRHFAPETETVFLCAGEAYQYVSSSAVREIARCRGDLGAWVPGCVVRALAKKF